MKLQQVLSHVRKAVDDYQMIEEGDKIAVGISGGKDSLTLLYALHGLSRFYPKHFTVHAVTVDLGFENLNLDKIKELCRNLDIEYTIVKTDIAQIVFEERKEDNPCSLCAKMRKGAADNSGKHPFLHTRILKVQITKKIFDIFSLGMSVCRTGALDDGNLIFMYKAYYISFIHVHQWTNYSELHAVKVGDR